MGSHSLLQGIFPTQGLNPGLPYFRQILYHLSHQENSRLLVPPWFLSFLLDTSTFPSVKKGYFTYLKRHFAFPGGSAGKESTCNVGDLGSVPELGRSPGGGHSHPLQYSCLGKFHGQRSLAGCNPWGRKESDMTGHTHIQHIICILEYVFQKS